MLTIVLADDHDLVRESIASLLRQVPDFNIVSQCRDGRQLIKTVEQLQPNVAVVDISMAELNGIDAARQIRKISPKTRIIALSIHTDEVYIRDMLRSGISGYVIKSGATKDLVDAIRYGSRGKVFFSHEIAETAKKIQRGEISSNNSLVSSERPLTLREREILQLIAEGSSSAEIASKLNISETTVKSHRNHLMDKLGVRDVAGLTRHAIRLKLIFID
jgi:DNA-binding NarL/FixJ family response regulator